jgi:Domain of unknown function (DUF4295)
MKHHIFFPNKQKYTYCKVIKMRKSYLGNYKFVEKIVDSNRVNQFFKKKQL